MKLLKTWSTFKASELILVLAAIAIWFLAPMLHWQGYAPLAQPEKRIYLISFLFLLWVLKILVLDLDAPNPFQYKSPQLRKKLQELQNRFQGALQFIKKTTVTKHHQVAYLNELPWFLLMGPTNAGKTSLLANSDVNFILQRQFQSANPQELNASEHCDWWITRDITIVDVPGKYLAMQEPVKNRKNSFYPVIWRFFLQLIRKQRGKHALSGIVIAMPFPDIMKDNDPKQYQIALRHLLQRLYEIQKVFIEPVPYYLVITKCDLLPGFNEFFSESGNDEITQAWGVTIPTPKQNETVYGLLSTQFNALIKKLNQQLLWRLHQERNPMARPYIKDFPLQVERLKEFTLDFIKKLSNSHFSLSLQGVYLSSALQNNTDTESTILDETLNTAQRAVQLFKAPSAASRPYFIKQLLTHGLTPTEEHYSTTRKTASWKNRIAYTTAALLIALVALVLGKDFKQGVNHSYMVQNNLTKYQLAIQHIQNADEHLDKTLTLLNSLKQSSNNSAFSFDKLHVLSFYTHKSEQKAEVVYQQALQSILLPEVKNYFAEYLQNPVNKNTEYLYATLKAYLMLGDSSRYDANFVITTLRTVLPKSFSDQNASDLMVHLNLALNTNNKTQLLNDNLIQETRKFLQAMPTAQLSYIILKNINNNNIEQPLNLGTNSGRFPVLTSNQVSNEVPAMFTAKAFSNIVTQEAALAAQETVMGNWVLGANLTTQPNAALSNMALEQLRATYINNYVDVWESLLANIQLSTPKNLAEADMMVSYLISNDSPLLQLLQTLHDNTYFEPISSASPKLQSLGALVSKNVAAQNQLLPIFTNLQALHQYMQAILTAKNEKKAAFEIVSKRMLNQNASDALSQLRLIAVKSPEPLRSWLEKIANDSWHFILQDAIGYIDISWQYQVNHFYQREIANRYPFNKNASQEVDLLKFSSFFGNPGIVTSFYNQYLQLFVDKSSADWHWKSIDNQKIPFSDDVLRQLQQANHIQQAFFPNGDNKLFVQFSLQPLNIGKNIKQVKLSINNKEVVDDKVGSKTSHLIAWPNYNDDKTTAKQTSLQFTLMNQKSIGSTYPGNWGWYKLINKSFETMISKKALTLNLSLDEQPAKYLLLVPGKINPFIALNLNHFRLPETMVEQKA